MGSEGVDGRAEERSFEEWGGEEGGFEGGEELRTIGERKLPGSLDMVDVSFLGKQSCDRFIWCEWVVDECLAVRETMERNPETENPVLVITLGGNHDKGQTSNLGIISHSN